MPNSARDRKLKEDEAEAKSEVRSLRRTAVGGWCTILFHFVVAQCRPIYTFYFSYKAYSIMFISYQVDHIVVTNPVEKAAREPTSMTYAEYTACIGLDVEALMNTWTTPMETNCIGTIEHQIFKFAASNRVYTGLNWLCEALCAVFVLIMVIELFKSGAKHVGHGRYIAFTWRVENSIPHKICAATLIVICILMLADFVRFIVYQFLKGTLMDASPFITKLIPALIGIITAAGALFKPSTIPKFDWQSEGFLELHLFRNLKTIHSNNLDFYNEVVKAVHEAERGHSGHLNEIAPGGDFSTQQQTAAGFQIKDKYVPLPTNE